MEHNARNEAKHTEPAQKASEKAAKKTRQSGQRLTPAQREEQILQVAAAHFAQHGVVAACMSSIAREAGITRALLYHYFPGKESLAAAVTPARSTGCS
ncbi:TetR/AcrR family transcriptional regulator [Rothia dentocariosa]|uniref:TetR/AcrR family transcriptional regulator n=1 Tax=Rothia dentocariosa TaxID=2047 RepID=UPI0039A1C9A1